MKRAEWNEIVRGYEKAIGKAMDAAAEHARLEAAEDLAHEAAKRATEERKAAGYRREVAHRDAEQAVMRYGQASAQRDRDGGTDEDRAEAGGGT